LRWVSLLESPVGRSALHLPGPPPPPFLCFLFLIALVSLSAMPDVRLRAVGEHSGPAAREARSKELFLAFQAHFSQQHAARPLRGFSFGPWLGLYMNRGPSTLSSNTVQASLHNRIQQLLGRRGVTLQPAARCAAGP
jgi:hypothetical protein